jgi:hypothetical protein
MKLPQERGVIIGKLQLKITITHPLIFCFKILQEAMLMNGLIFCFDYFRRLVLDKCGLEAVMRQHTTPVAIVMRD